MNVMVSLINFKGKQRFEIGLRMESKRLNAVRFCPCWSCPFVV